MIVLQAHRWRAIQLGHQHPKAAAKPRAVVASAKYRRAGQVPAGRRLRLRRTLLIDEEDSGEQEEDAEEALQEGPSGAQQTTRQPDQDAERRASGAQASTSSSSSTSSSTPTVLPNGPQRQQQQQEHRQQQQRQQQAPGSSGSGSSTQGAAGPRPGQGAGAGVGDVATRQTYASCLPAGIRPAGVEGGSGRVVLDPVYASRNAAVATALELAGAWVPPSLRPPSQPAGKRGLVIPPSTAQQHPASPQVRPAASEIQRTAAAPPASSGSAQDPSWKEMIRNGVPLNGTTPSQHSSPLLNISSATSRAESPGGNINSRSISNSSSDNSSSSTSPSTSSSTSNGTVEVGDWTSALQASGFVVRTSPTGEVYLERTAAPKAKSSTAPPGTASGSKPTQQTPSPSAQASRAAGTVAAPGSNNGTRSSPSSAKGSEPGSAMGSVTGSVAAAAARKKQAPSATATSAAPPRMALPAADPRQPPGLKAALRAVETPEQVLDVAAALFPHWALSGCRLAAPDVLVLAAAEAQKLREELQTRSSSSGSERASAGSSGSAGNGTTSSSSSSSSGALRAQRSTPGVKGGPPRLGLAPTPAQAAQLLQALGIACQRRKWSTARRLELCGDPRVAGLVEALRLGPPRLSLEQSSSPSISSAITAAASQAARMYWVAPVPGAVQNPQQAAQTPQQAVIQGCQQQKQQQQGPPPAAGMGPEYERILQRYNRGGSSTSGAVQGAGQQQYSQQDTPQGKRHQALVAAMWALACLGGPLLYQTEMEALLALSRAGATTWRFGPGEGGSTLWALAHARHYTPRLADIERGLVQDGGLAVRPPPEVSRLLWSFATLNYCPSRLLATVQPGWAWSTGSNSGGLESFTTEELATVAWSLAVLRALHPSTSSEARPAAAAQPGQAPPQASSQQAAGEASAAAAGGPSQQHHQGTPATAVWAELCGRGKEVEAAGDIVLTQVWQTAMAIRLDAPSFSSSGVGQSSSTTSSSTTSTQRVGGSRSDALSATMDAALGYLSLAQQQPSGLEQNSTSHIADTTTSAARAMLQKAARSFAAGTAALQSRSSSSTSSALSASLSSQLPAAGSGSSGHSAYQRQIGASLARLRLMHVLEDCTSGYAIDVTLPSMRIAIEADGPSHFSRTPHTPRPGAATPAVLGPTAMKRRHLKALGWTVISVKWQDWDRLSLPGSRERFLHGAINRVLTSQMEAALAQQAGAQQQETAGRQEEQQGVKQQQWSAS